jgi:hypothetical protein
MKEGPPSKKEGPKEDIYIDNRYINLIMSAIREGDDTLELYENVAEELLRQLDSRSSEPEKAKFLGKALMTLVHTAQKRRRVGDPLTGESLRNEG